MAAAGVVVVVALLVASLVCGADAGGAEAWSPRPARKPQVRVSVAILTAPRPRGADYLPRTLAAWCRLGIRPHVFVAGGKGVNESDVHCAASVVLLPHSERFQTAGGWTMTPQNFASLRARRDFGFYLRAISHLLAATDGRTLAVEDDFVPCEDVKDGVEALMRAADANFAGGVTSFGGNGLLFATKDLRTLSTYVANHRAGMTVGKPKQHDHVCMEWLLAETPEAAQTIAGRRTFAVSHNLYEHIGLHSATGHTHIASGELMPCGRSLKTIPEGGVHFPGIGFETAASCVPVDNPERPPRTRMEVSPCAEGGARCAEFDVWLASCAALHSGGAPDAEYQAKCCLAELPEHWLGCSVRWDDATGSERDGDPLGKGCHVELARPKDTLGAHAFFDEAPRISAGAGQAPMPGTQWLVAFQNDTGLAAWTAETARAAVLPTDLESYGTARTKAEARSSQHVHAALDKIAALQEAQAARHARRG